MASDPSVYNQLGAGVTPMQNPLAMQAQTAQTANALLGVQNLRRTLDAQTGEQQAYSGALNPDGSYDAAKLQAGLSTLPSGAGAAVAQGLSLQRGQQVRSSEAQSNVAQMIVSLGTLPDSAMTGDTFRQGIGQSVKGGSMTQHDGEAAMSDLPPDGSPPAAYRLYVLRHGAQNLSTPEGQKLLYGQTSLPDVGPGLQPLVTQSPAMGGGVQKVGPMIGKATDPTTRAALVPTYDKDPDHPGSYIQVLKPRSDLPGASGVTNDPNAPPNPMGNGSYPTPPQAGQPAPASSTLAGIPPAAASQNAADQKAYQEAQSNTKPLQDSMLALQHAHDALKLSSGSGPGTETTQKLKSFLVAQGYPVPQETTDQVANYDLFRKAVNAYAGTQGAASNTDAGRSLAQHSNANTDISTPANMEVLAQEMGKKRQELVANLTAPDKAGIGFLGHKTNLIAGTDPRGFSVDFYTPQQNAAYATSLKTPEQKAKFYKAAGMVSRLGLAGASSTGAPTAAPTVPTGG